MPLTAGTRRGPGVPTVTAALGVALGAGLAWAPSAAAHDDLVRSVPAAGSTVAAAPAAVELTFAGSQVSASLEVRDGCDRPVAWTATTDGASMRAELRTPDEAEPRGSWTVAWTTVGGDGHPVEGELTFTVAGTPDCSATGPAATDPIARGPVDGAPTAALVPAEEAPGTEAAAAVVPGGGSVPSGALLAGGVVILAGAWLGGDRLRHRRSGRRDGERS